MSILATVATASALAAGAIAGPATGVAPTAAPAAAPTAAAPTAAADQYQVCVPNGCLVASQASVRGTVDWDSNVNTFTAINRGYLMATVTFTQYDDGRPTLSQTLGLAPGTIRLGATQVSPATDALEITLCGRAPTWPTCATVVVTR